MSRFCLYMVLVVLSLFLDGVYGQLRFASFGNFGYDNKGEKQVGETLKKIAKDEHISFIASPGSNFPGGVSAVNDTIWQTHFEDIYNDPSGVLKVPFFTVLGAEDWSGDYTSQILKTEEAYSDISSKQNYPKWTLPNWWHHHLMHFPAPTGSALQAGHKDMSAGIIFIDTWVLSSSFPFSDVTNQAWADLQKILEIAPKFLDYIIVVGDRPIYSSGASKGDSSLQYYLLPLLKKANVNAYISGYDFDLEVIESDGILYANCGSGSIGGGTAMMHDENSKFFSGESGFCLFELTADGLQIKLIDGIKGETLYTSKQPIINRPQKKSINAFAYVSELPEVRYWPIPAMGKMPGKDAFVRIVGTIGLCIGTIFAAISIATAVSRTMK